MTRIIVGTIAAGLMFALAGTAQAATRTTTFAVTATVVDNCLIDAGDLSFGAFDGTGDLASTSTITVRCSNGTDYTVDLSPGTSGNAQARLMTSATSAVPLAYNLFTDANHATIWANGQNSTGRASGTGAGMGTAQPHTVYGLLAAADNLGQVDAGSFSDTITATITY